MTTLFSVNNAGEEPTLAHLTFWTDQGVPALWFDVYLTGYDIQTFNLRDVFCHGNISSTGFAVSNQGPLSSANVAFADCNNTTTPGDNPLWAPGAISSTFRILAGVYRGSDRGCRSARVRGFCSGRAYFLRPIRQ
jgi:hypothetical protein